MLDLYKESQADFYEMITSIVLEHHKISHAYLIDTANFAEAKSLVFSFAKFLLCKNHYTNSTQCLSCNLCSFIDNNVDSHIQVIAPDGVWIKKEQLMSLKNELNKKSIDGLPQIYIIQDAECLNKAAANSLLKFLEEPEEGIIAILVSSNRYKILPTIISRCQVYQLKGESLVVVDECLDSMVDFLMNIERQGCQTICYIQDLWHSKYKTKEDFIRCFNQLESLFVDLIHFKIKGEIQFSDYREDFEYIVCHNSEEDLIRKLSLIISCREDVQYNANLALLMDKFIIEYVGGEKKW